MIAFLLLVLPLSRAFAPVAKLSISSDTASCSLQKLRPTAAIVSGYQSSSELNAKKRRRRKAAPTPANSDELPDFDDGEDNDVIAKSVGVDSSTVDSPMQQVKASSSTLGDALSGRSSTSSTPIKRGSGLNQQLAEEVGGNVDGLDEDTILEAMRGKAGTSWTPPRSIDDTLRDRRLEKFMDFDKMIEQDGGGDGSAVDLPDFEEVIARRRGREAVQEGRVEIDTAGMGKKAARNAQRKAAAVQRASEIEEEKANPFEDLNILKLLENGAWVGIGLLVVWEIYINSPFFDRAAPLIPVVYDTPGDTPIPPGMEVPSTPPNP